MNDWETIEKIRKDIIGEFEAINQYIRHAETTNNLKTKKLLMDIAYEESVHVGELFALLFELDPKSAEAFMEGQQEAKDILRAMAYKK